MTLSNIDVLAYVKQYMHVLIIMRGVPGSGKSYAAEKIHENFKKDYTVAIHSTDQFFMKDGQYRFNRNALGIAHKWNQNRTRESLQDGVNVVIVDNTNTTWKEIKPYAEMAKDNNYFVILAEANNEWSKNAEECVKRNQHGVPFETIQSMLGRWESSDSIVEKLSNNIVEKLEELRDRNNV